MITGGAGGIGTAQPRAFAARSSCSRISTASRARTNAELRNPPMAGGAVQPEELARRAGRIDVTFEGWEP